METRPAEPDDKIIDLIEALRASLEQAQEQRAGLPGGANSTEMDTFDPSERRRA